MIATIDYKLRDTSHLNFKPIEVNDDDNSKTHNKLVRSPNQILNIHNDH